MLMGDRRTPFYTDVPDVILVQVLFAIMSQREIRRHDHV